MGFPCMPTGRRGQGAAIPEIILRCSGSGPARTRWSAAGIFISARLLTAGALLGPCIGRHQPLRLPRNLANGQPRAATGDQPQHLLGSFSANMCCG